MKKNYFQTAFIAAALTTSFSVDAQKIAKKLVVVNGGSSNVVTVDPSGLTNSTTLGAISSTSTQDVLIHNHTAYIAAVDSIVKFDLISGDRTSAACAGVTEFEVNDNKLLVVKGYGASSNYFEIRSLTDLNVEHTFSDVNEQAEDLVVLNDTAYITIPGVWGTTIGKVAVIDLKNNQYVRTDDLGTTAKGIGRITIVDNQIYTVSSHGWNAPDFSIHQYNNVNASWTETSFNGTYNGYSGLALKNGNIYISINDTVRELNPSNMQIVNQNFTTKKLSTLFYDNGLNTFYGTNQSYVSNGKLFAFDQNGNITDSITIGIAAEAIAMAYNQLPVANVDKAFLIKNEQSIINPLDNDVDPENTTLTPYIISTPNNATVTLNSSNQLVLNPNAVGGLDSMEYGIVDIWGDTGRTKVYTNTTDPHDIEVVTFENLNLPADSFYNGADQWGGFVSNGAFFPNSYNPKWNSWNGFSYSSKVDTVTNHYTNQFAAITGEGVLGSSTFGVGYGKKGGFEVSSDPAGEELKGTYITNATLTALTIKNGGGFGAKQFGGPTGDDPDYFMIRFYGVKQNGTITDSIDFYLADYRDTDNTKDYVVKDWKYVDFTKLGKVNAIRYELFSTDINQYGMLTPQYICLDNINGDGPVSIEKIKEASFNVFPNPVQHELVLFSDKVYQTGTKITVLDIQGRVVTQLKSATAAARINTTNWNNGLYIVRIQYDNRIETHRIIKE